MRCVVFLMHLTVLPGCIGVKSVGLGRHDQLENQILGRLQALEADVILASSVRGQRPPAGGPAEKGHHVAHSPLAREAIDAARRRAFNRDDIEQFKSAGRLGERRDARLQILGRQDPADPRRARWLTELVDAENHDREVLMRRALQLTPELKRDDMPLVRHAFFHLLLQTAKPGQRVQRADGHWGTIGESEERNR